jgi:aspartate 1-decarboxylase
MITVIRAKLHDIRVTDAHLDYQGSVTLDPEHCEAVGILPLEFVEIWNKSTGARISTYVIWGERGSRCCVLNGAAARTCQPGDTVIVAASMQVRPQDVATVVPRVALMDADNRIRGRLEYRVGYDRDGRMNFRIARLGPAAGGARGRRSAGAGRGKRSASQRSNKGARR